MRQAPRSPLSFKLQRVANVPERPPPSTRLMSYAHIANRRLSRIIGARSTTPKSTTALCDTTHSTPTGVVSARRKALIRRLAPHHFVNDASDLRSDPSS